MKRTDLIPQNKSFKVNRADGDSANSGENFFKNLLNTVGGDGIKTDVSITLAPSNFIYMGIAIVAAVVIASGIVYLIKTTFTKTA